MEPGIVGASITGPDARDETEKFRDPGQHRLVNHANINFQFGDSTMKNREIPKGR